MLEIVIETVIEISIHCSTILKIVTEILQLINIH